MRRDAAIFFGILALTCAVYLPVLQNGFVDYDDEVYVFLNPHVQAGLTMEGVRWAFTTMTQSNWHPLTWLSHIVDCQLFGLKAAWHHAISVIIHALNAGLLFLVLRRMTGAVGRSAVVAVLFALHPLHVESVAWVAERKDVLSTLFWLLTMLAYERYVRHPSWQRYLAVICLFAMGLMAKPMLVTLPCVLLVMDWWPLGRFAGAAGARAWWRRLGALTVEKIPLFALVAVSCVLTFIAQTRGGAVVSHDALPPGWRVANALVAYAAYLGNTLWPTGLAVFYPHRVQLPVAEIVVGAVVMAAITVVVVRFRSRSYALAGWLWYLGTLVPVIGLVQVGEQAMADRYTYVPLVGVFVALVWGAADGAAWMLARLGHPGRTRGVLTAAAVAVVTACGAVTVAQERYWRDSETLFGHALKVTRDNSLAHYNLGTVLVRQGRVAEATGHFQEALRIKPAYADAHNNLGSIWARQGRSAESVQQFQEALRIKPDHADAHYNLGVALLRQGSLEEAVGHFQETVRLKPDHADGHNNMGVALVRLGKVAEATDQFRETVRLKPGDPDARNNFGAILARQGRGAEAIEQFREALRLKPDHAGAQKNLGAALQSVGKNAGR